LGLDRAVPGWKTVNLPKDLRRRKPERNPADEAAGTEDALETSESLLSSIIEQTPFSTWIADANGTNIRQNAACRKLFGISSDEETVGKYNLFRDEELKRKGLLQKVRRVFEEGRPARFTIDYDFSKVRHVRVPGATHRVLDVTIFPIKDASGKVVNAVIQHDDVTERRAAMAALAKRLACERMVADISRRAANVRDMRQFELQCLRIIGETMDVSHACILRYRPEANTLDHVIEWAGSGVKPRADERECVSLDDLAHWREHLAANRTINLPDVRKIRSKADRELLEQRGVKSLLAVPLYMADAPYGFLALKECRREREWPPEDVEILQMAGAIIVGVVERLRAKTALEESESRYRRLVENAPEGIWSIDRQGITTYVNARMSEMLGFTVEEMLGTSIYSYMDAEAARAAERDLWRHRPWEVQRIDVKFRRRDGSWLDTCMQSWTEADERGRRTGATAFIADLSEQRELEKLLRQSQKLEAIGTLAGGIAHEFKNLLMGISAYTEILQMKLGQNHPDYSVTDDLLKCVEKSSRLVNQILAFSRKQSLDPRPTDLNQLVAESEHLLARLVGEHISIELDLTPEPIIVSVDPSQIEQVLLNLTVNARDAMPQGGRLWIRTRRTDVRDDGRPGYLTLPPGAYAELSVADTGIGMDESTRERVFEPFFTTKDRGERSGLGLSVVYGIIKQHRGNIEVRSKPGKGSSFRVLLPLTDGEPLVKTREKPLPEESFRRDGTGRMILLVEDEDTVREPLQYALEEIGYTVISAENGRRGIELFRRHSDSIDLVILDLIMPRMSGMEACEAMRKVRPDLKALFISGHSPTAMDQAFAPPANMPLLWKPFTLAELENKLTELLG